MKRRLILDNSAFSLTAPHTQNLKKSGPRASTKVRKIIARAKSKIQVNVLIQINTSYNWVGEQLGFQEVILCGSQWVSARVLGPGASLVAQIVKNLPAVRKTWV